MIEYGIYSMEDGSLVMRGYWADSADEALDQYLADYPKRSADDYYAAEYRF